ncbi:MAG: LolA family protein [Longimicrobiales bacterium]
MQGNVRISAVAVALVAVMAACTADTEPTPQLGGSPETGAVAATPAPTPPASGVAVSDPPPPPARPGAQPSSPAPPTSSPAPTASSPRPAPAPPVAAPAPSSAGAQDDGALILRGAAAAYENIRAIQADFTMQLENPLLRTKTTSRGTLSQRRPDRILLKFTEPEGDVIVGDGTHFWVYYPSIDKAQVTRAAASEASAGGVDLQAQFLGDPAVRFRYTLHGQETVDGRTTHVLTMVPKEEAGYERLKVWVDERDSLVRRFELTEHNGTVRRFDLANLRVNPELNDALFRFTPPAGVRIVGR